MSEETRVRRTLTDKGVERLAPPPAGRVDLFDAVLPGFALRVSASGVKSFVVFYRINGRQRRYTVGRYPAFKVGEAREAARGVLRKVAGGIDPAEEKASRRDALNTFGALAADFIERYAKPNKSSWKLDQRRLENHVLPVWRNRPPDSIGRADVIRLLEDVAKERAAPIP